VGIRTPVGRHLLAFHIAHCLFREYSPRHVNFLHAHRKGTVLKINGVTMCELDDRDPRRLVHGWLALQVHVGPPMCVQFKDIYLRRL